MGAPRKQFGFKPTPKQIETGVAVLCLSLDEIGHKPKALLASIVVEVYLAMLRSGQSELDREKMNSARSEPGLVLQF